jgi:hypothetical protein
VTPVVVYDACVLYPSPLRDFLIRVAIEELVWARWSDRILDEVFRNVRKDRPDLDPRRLERTRRMMCAAVLDCLVAGFEGLEETLTLPDKDDRHVVAAAIQAGARTILTFNLRDFPAAELAPHGLVAQHPDPWAVELLKRAPVTVLTVLHQQAADLRNPPQDVWDVLGTLERCGLVQFAAAVRSEMR